MTRETPPFHLPDLFPGYEARWIETSAGEIFARLGGSGPPLLMLHGYAQTHVMWHCVAPSLAKRFTLVLADLPGYGWSAAPEAHSDHWPYTKRGMADAMIEVMQSLGYDKFRLAGHDRGGRAAYRLALDHPETVERLAVLETVPIWNTWRNMNAPLAYRIWNWNYLALPAPFPEHMIGQDPIFYWNFKTAQNTKLGTLSAFAPAALEHYRSFFTQPARIHATCEDYRAGHTTDYKDDEVDVAAGKKILCPTLVLWGDTGVSKVVAANPLTVWQEWADTVSGKGIDSGHFLAEENPTATAAELLDFFTAN